MTATYLFMTVQDVRGICALMRTSFVDERGSDRVRVFS